MEPLLRLRLKFFGGHILSKSQKFDGLKRSWVLLKPQHETISEVALHILHAFDLSDSCPDGLILSKDGFVLPPSQPLNILKDGDLICVKRRQAKSIDVTEEHEQPNTSMNKIIDEQPKCMKLVANNEFAEETGGYDSDTEVEEIQQRDCLNEQTTPNGYAVLRKQKASKEVRNFNAKRRQAKSIDVIKEHGQPNTLMNKIIDEQPTDVKLLANNEFAKETGGYASDTEVQDDQHRNEQPTTNECAVLKKRKSSKELKSSKSKRRRKLSPQLDEVPPLMKEISCSLSRARRQQKKLLRNKNKVGKQASGSKNPEKQGEGPLTLDNPGQDSTPSKLKGSRSSKRKRQQRAWLRNKKLDEKQTGEPEMNGDMGSTKEENSKNCQPVEEIESGEEIVPVMIRPGHIRFAPSGKEKEVAQHMPEKELYQWKGTLGKRKGQKWGQEKQQSSPKFNEAKQYKELSAGLHKWARDNSPTHDCNAWEKPSSSGWEKQTTSSRWNEYKPPNRNYFNGDADWKMLSANNRIDFEKLVPLTDNPVEGDTLAYRLLVLSSTFCPELSSYRVGKVSSFDPKSNIVVLVPVPEYPFDFEKGAVENISEELPTSPSYLYKEDGSLELDFPSLADVRIVKLRNQLGDATTVSKAIPSWSAITGQTSSPAEPVIYTPVTNCSGPETGKKDVWEEISEALNAKKAQLQESKWNKKANSSNRSRSWGGALGPTMARLRAENAAS